MKRETFVAEDGKEVLFLTPETEGERVELQKKIDLGEIDDKVTLAEYERLKKVRQAQALAQSLAQKWENVEKGGPGSGFFDHSGRPGERGGSASDGGGSTPVSSPPSRSEIARQLTHLKRTEMSTHGKIREARKVIESIRQNPNATAEQIIRAKRYSDLLSRYEEELPEFQQKKGVGTFEAIDDGVISGDNLCDVQKWVEKGSVGSGKPEGYGGGGSSPGGSFPKSFVSENVFGQYVPKAQTTKEGRSEPWQALNRKIGALEARIGHTMVKAGKETGRRRAVLVKYAQGLENALVNTVDRRMTVAKQADSKSIPGGPPSQDEIDDLLSVDISDIVDTVIAEVAEKLVMEGKDVEDILDSAGIEKKAGLIESMRDAVLQHFKPSASPVVESSGGAWFEDIDIKTNLVIYTLGAKYYTAPYTLKDDVPVIDFDQAKEVERIVSFAPVSKDAKVATGTPEEKKAGIVKADEEKHYILAAVYVPNVIDSQDQWATAETIEKMCWDFGEKCYLGKGKMRIQHKGEVNRDAVVVVENFIARELMFGYPAGTWFVGSRIYNAELWKAAKNGDFTAYSLGGRADLRERSPE